MLTNKELGEYLEKIRKQRNLTLRQVDYKSDVSYSHLSMIEKGTRKALPLTLKELAKVYNIDYIDLLEKAGYIDLAEKEKITYVTSENWINEKKYKKEINSDGTVSYKAKFEPIPVIGKIAAGQPILAQENIESYLPVDPNIYGLTSTDDLFYLLVSGQSMNMKVKNGDYALIHKQDYAEDGDIVVAIVNGDDEATLKRYKKLNDQFVLLEPMSTDPSIEAITVDLKNTNFKIIGKAIGQFGKF